MAYDEWLPLITISVLVSFLLSAYLYISSLLSTPSSSPSAYLAPHGQTSNRIYDFFVGRTLNPRLLSVDLKYLCELRPGLVGWILVDASFASVAWARGTLTASMVLVLLFQAVYVVDALWSEEAILTTMDITTDGFGYMLVFGDLSWVPFTYSLQARYLVDRPTTLHPAALAVVLALELIGLAVFRSSNNEKNTFRTDAQHPFTRSARYLSTHTGGRLLLSGWWGRSRHPNYAGDWLMALSWSLLCGVQHPIVYFYPLYFAVLLIHRQRRDDHKCGQKYGRDWDKYCALVPYRIIPFIY